MATRNTYIIAVIVVIIVIAALSAFVLMGTPAPTTPTTSTTSTTSGGGATTIYLVAQNIKFNSTNPTITVAANTQITINVDNKDSVPHNFVIKGVSGGTTNLLSPGQSGSVTVTLPPGTYQYSCSVHPGQMDGQIIAK